MQKSIKVDGRDVLFRCTASTPRKYRYLFGKDIFTDAEQLMADVRNRQTLTPDVLEVFENLAYVMAKQADPDIPNSPDEWLDGFGMFSIYEILPQIIDLWHSSLGGIESVKKKPSEKNNKEERPLTTALFLLRCAQVGLSMSDLDLLDIGMILDMFVEKSKDMPADPNNDEVRIATAEDVARW